MPSRNHVYKPVDTTGTGKTPGGKKQRHAPEKSSWYLPSRGTCFKLLSTAGIVCVLYYFWNTGAFSEFDLTQRDVKAFVHYKEAKDCPQICFANVEKTCDLDICLDCEYSCFTGECLFDQLTFARRKKATDSRETCRDWCGRGSEASDHCATSFCKTCDFCAPVTFADMTDSYLPKSDPYWNEWKHSGKPYTSNDSPLFTDLNGDGILDLFNSMHGHAPDEHGNDRWELCLGEEYNKPHDNKKLIKFVSVAERIHITDDPSRSMDAHGRNLLDLDGDSIPDMFVDQGGSQGNANENAAADRVSLLLWGELDDSHTPVFVGGRQTAIDAGVDMYYGRGRVNYIFDANQDGYLDIFIFQDRNVLNKITPGVLLYNNKDRTWSSKPNDDDDKADIREYTRTMILTDADGDGFAQEVVLNRNFCLPQREGPETDPKFPEYGPYTDDVMEFCSTRPVGTTAIFKYNPSSKSMEQISPKYRNVSAENDKTPPCCPNGSYSTANDCNANSMASADFDGDLLADLIVSYKHKLVFYFSTDRNVGDLPVGHVGLELFHPKECGQAGTVRVVDLDNDGVEEIVVFCVIPLASVLVYTRADDSGKLWNLDNGYNAPGALGSLVDETLPVFTKQDYADTCKVDSSTWAKVVPYCKYSQNPNIHPKPHDPVMEGVSSVDLNNDGFVDFVVSYNFGYTRFIQNQPKSQVANNRFVAFRLVGAGPGKGSNLYGIGATVILHVKHGFKTTKHFKEFSTYQHTPDWYGYKDDRIVFGLGEHGVPIKVEIRWPNGTTQTKSLTSWNFTPGKFDVIDLVQG